jgi:CubicO group peptidase (beta-lactamase class C family)
MGTTCRVRHSKAARAVGAGWLITAIMLAACTAVPTERPNPSTTASTQPAAAPSPPDADFAAIERELTRALTDGDPRLEGVRSVLVSVAGDTVIEYYHQGTPTDHADVWSVTKSVTSILVGVAIDEGLLTVDQTLAELLPDHAASMTEEEKSITLKQLLTMTAGFPTDDDILNTAVEDTVPLILTYGLIEEPGAAFHYSNSSAHLVAAVLQQAIDGPILDYAREKLFDPLGIDTSPAWDGYDLGPGGGYEEADFAWPTDRSGVHLGFAGLKLTAPDLVKLGELYVNQGSWRGRQVVSADWVRASTSSQLTAEQEASDGPYGYLWWTGDIEGHASFLASGSYYQRVWGVPARQTVVVVSASDEGGADDIGEMLGPVLDKVFASLMQ